jgi:hypothetical protein
MQVVDAEVMGVSLDSVSWRTDGGCGSEYCDFFPWWLLTDGTVMVQGYPYLHGKGDGEGPPTWRQQQA